jgi:equilibrative nucleoside transporter 1/2/3
MFLAAAPYFQRRFQSNDSILRNFQSGILSVSTVGNMGSMIVLTKLQARANYPKRITVSLALNAVVFTLLAISTKFFLDVSAGVYFAFLLVMVFSASLATGLCQNGVFAYVSSFAREEYTQAIMTGQGIAGVLPAITQIISVLSVPAEQHGHPQLEEPSTSAFAYFITATLVCLLTLMAFFSLLSRSQSKPSIHQDLASSTSTLRKSIPLTHLFKKLCPLATGIFISFAITMFFPVFTSRILSVHDPAHAPRLLQPATFIPLAFFFWNLGDLLGRTGPALPALRITHRPRLVLCLALSRVAFIPLYFLCNVDGKGAVVSSDVFYLFVVQALFGLSNGYVGSSCMMGFAEWVEPEEREAAGGFMSLCLVAGLTVGSFLSFGVAAA